MEIKLLRNTKPTKLCQFMLLVICCMNLNLLHSRADKMSAVLYLLPSGLKA